MKFDDELILLLGEIAALEIWPKVIDPPETAALAAPQKAGSFWQGAPAPLTMSPNIRDQPIILLFCPCAFVCVCLLAAR
jgi:hypothetical protein